jgi:putative cell wall-binding protein
VTRNWTRRASTTALVALLIGASLAAIGLVSPASAAPSTTSRISGGSRYDTAAKVALRQFDGPVQTIVVTTGEKFPDALVAGPLAAAGQAKPMLLVQQSSIPSETRSAIQELDPQGAIIVGGTGAVSSAVAAELEQLTGSAPQRIQGFDRYETSVRVSEAAFTGSVDTVFLAFGGNFPDAVVAGSLGAEAQAPVLLVEKSVVPSVVRERLVELSPTNIHVVGGEGVVDNSVLDQVQDATGVRPTRIAGTDRFSTSVVGSGFAFPNGADTVYIATGRNFPDALAAGPAAAADRGPVLLVDTACMPEVVRLEIERLGADTMIVIGGETVVSPATAAMQSCDPPARGTITSDVRFSGGGAHGWAVYLNIHDAFGNGVAMGVQDDAKAPETFGKTMVHANVFRADAVNGQTGFDHLYGSLELQQNTTYEFRLDYLHERQLARLYVDGSVVLEIGVAMRDRLFFQTEVNVANNGDFVDATFGDVRIGGHIPGGNGRSNTVEPNGTWNTSSFDFYDLDMEQLDTDVQGAEMRGHGTASGVPAGHDWHTVETVRPGEPLAAIGMIAEFWFNQ